MCLNLNNLKISVSFKMYFMYPLLLANLIRGQNPVSPCPAIFKYQYDGSMWYGVIQLRKPPIGRITMNIKMSIRAPLTNNYFGTIKLTEERSTTIDNILASKSISYRVEFPVQTPLPRPTMIMVNKKLLCRTRPEFGAITLIQLEHTLYAEKLNNKPNDDNVFKIDERNGFQAGATARPQVFQPKIQNRFGEDNDADQSDVNVQRTTSQRPIKRLSQVPFQQLADDGNQQANNKMCGRTLLAGNALIIGGQATERGKNPWLVAFYSQISGSVQYRCGATLVSKKLVITAAHCIYDDQLKRSLTPTEVVLFLGRFNIKSWSETDYLARDVEQLIIHEDYKVRSEASYDADIGLMIMKKPAVYNQYIRPICLWTGRTDLNEIVGQNGIVTGWGRDDHGTATTSTPRTVTVPIVSNKVCLSEHESFRYLTSSRTFCAGDKSGFRGPCNGDSGGGLIIYRNGQSYLRGIVSASLRDPKTGLCNLNSYIVFTDVALFSNWIRPHL